MRAVHKAMHETGAAADSRILRAIRLFEQRLDETVLIADVAAELGLSLHHFHRLFLSQTGETPAGYVRRMRLISAGIRLRWTPDPTITIAQDSGFRSRTAFVNAFKAFHGAAPSAYRRAFLAAGREVAASGAGQRIALREIESFRLIVRRYVGDLDNVPDYWADFMAALPRTAISGKPLYLGLMFEDPRTTPAGKARYDCAMTVPAGPDWSPGSATMDGLDIIETRPGRYACMSFSGPPGDIAAAYDELGACLRQKRYPLTNDPAIELHHMPRHLQPDDRREFTIMLPIH